MAGSFIFDRRDSRSFGLIVEGKRILNGAEPEVEEYKPPGRNGSVFRFTGRRENVEVSYDTFLKAPGRSRLQPWATEVKQWLLAKPGEYLRLEDTWDPEHFRLAAYVTGMELENPTPVTTRQTAVFSCLPYRYRKSGEIPAAVAMAPVTGAVQGKLILYNTTGYPSEPLLRFGLMKGNLVPTVSIHIDYADGTVYEGYLSNLGQEQDSAVLDCTEQTVLFADGSTNHFNEIDRFPVLKPGENKITLTGERLLSAEIVPRWMEL